MVWTKAICDTCGKERSCQTFTERESDGCDNEVTVCFLCRKTSERRERKLELAAERAEADMVGRFIDDGPPEPIIRQHEVEHICIPMTAPGGAGTCCVRCNKTLT